MAVTILNGPMGLSGRHSLRGLVMNQPGSWPWVELLSISGLRAKAESDQPTDPLTGRWGEVMRWSQLRGKNVVYSGQVNALDLDTLDVAVSALAAVCSDESDTTLDISPDPARGGLVLSALGHPAAFTCDEDLTQREVGDVPMWFRPFVLTFRMRDPRFFAQGAPVTVGAADGAGVALTAGGNAPTEPAVVTASASGTVDVENVTQGTLLRLSGLAGAGALLVDFPGRAVSQVGLGDVSGAIDWDASTWWDEDRYGVAPTAETIKVTGAGAWTVTAVPAVF